MLLDDDVKADGEAAATKNLGEPVLGYALLGAGWLVLKSEGELRDWAYRRVFRGKVRKA